MRFKQLFFLIIISSLRLSEGFAHQLFVDSVVPKQEAELFAKYRFRHIMSLSLSGNGHQIMGAGALGKEGLAELVDYLAKENMQPLKTVLFIHKEGFKNTEESSAFALEELAYCSDHDMTFLHPFNKQKSLYIDGLNPLNVKAKDAMVDLSQYFEEGSDLDDPPHAFDLSGGVNALLDTLSIALNKSMQPVLIHCRAGRHRTAMIQMVLRYLEGGQWTDAKKSYYGSFRYKKRKDKLIELDDLLPLEYEYFQNARPKARMENIDFIRELMYSPEHSELRSQLKKLYQESL